MRRTWRARAACRGAATALFFPEPGDDAQEALEVCGRCPVTADCAEHARRYDEAFGIWGGRAEDERRIAQPRVSTAPRRPGPPTALDDAHLIELVRGMDPAEPAAPQLLAQLHVSVPAAYKYLDRALRLGVVEHRGRRIYPSW